MDDVTKLNGCLKNPDFEPNLSKNLWDAIIPYVFKNIYLPNALNGTSIGFRTQMEIQLTQWIENGLTKLTLDVLFNVFFLNYKIDK